MSKVFVAKVTTKIDAARPEVWDALTQPRAIRQYMFGAEVETDWRVGSEIIWKGEFKGKKFEDKGVLLKYEPAHVLSYTHYSGASGKPDRPENYHTVTVELSGEGGTTKLTLRQDGNPDQASRDESEKNWGTMMDGLKKYVEKSCLMAPA